MPMVSCFALIPEVCKHGIRSLRIFTLVAPSFLILERQVYLGIFKVYGDTHTWW